MASPGAGRRLLVTVAILLIFATPARGQIDEAAFRQHLDALTRHPTRVVGSEGYVAAGNYIERQIRAMPNVELRRHELTVMMPVTRSAILRRAGATQDEPIHPFWP